MKKEPEITSHHPKQKKLGTYFTPTPVAEWISSRVLDMLFEKNEIRNIKIYDPTIGEGVFLTAIVNNNTTENASIRRFMRIPNYRSIHNI